MIGGLFVEFKEIKCQFCGIVITVREYAEAAFTVCDDCLEKVDRGEL